MNSRDSELVSGMLIKAGYVLAESVDAADIVLFNTCSVRQHAEDKVWSEIGKYRRQKSDDRRQKGKRYSLNAKRWRRKPIIGLIGCMAQEHQQAAFAKSPLIDLVVGPNNISSIPSLLDDLQSGFGKALAVGREQRDAFVYNTEYIAEKFHCNVNIMEGCDNYCSYCIVPYVRGRERSRPAEDIIDEIKVLIKKGVKEITLLGQNVNSYRSLQTTDDRRQRTEEAKKPISHKPLAMSFVDLLKIINGIEGLEKFDFVTSHPKDANVKLFRTMAELPKCKNFLHLPVQSGSDRILKLMNRGYTRSQYLKLLEDARKIIPELRLTTDIMVGFPQETEKDFQDTFDLVKQARFDSAYIFKYSSRPYTEAAKMKDDVPLAEKKRRNQILLQFQKEIHKKRIDK